MSMTNDIEAAFTPPSQAIAPPADCDHSAWDSLLARHLRPPHSGPSRLAYAAFSAADRALLAGYLGALQRRGVAGLNRAGQFAFWLNLYNAQTVAVVLEHYPVGSIRDISLGGGVRASLLGGPWQKRLMRVDGIRLCLDEIENAILRRLFRDPRLHYALNCASIGCPSLMPRAFTAEGLEATLQTAARDFIASPRGVAFGPRGPVVSQIFEWYARDFGGTDRMLLQHLACHAEEPLRSQLLDAKKIAGYQYDWGLNDCRD